MQKLKSFILSAIAAFLLAPSVLAQSADLLTEKSGPDQAAAGADVTYTVTVTNLGPDDASSVTLNDPIPGTMTFVSATQDSGPTFLCSTPTVGSGGTVTCTIATLPAGAYAQFSFVFNIPGGTAPGTTFTNVATSTTTSVDYNDENNSGTAGTSTPPPPQADLFIQKTGPSSAGPDSDVAYTITVSNNGPDAAVDLAWSDTLPGTMTFVSLTQDSGPAMTCTTPTPVECSVTTFNAGDTATFTLVGHIPAGTPSGTGFDNVADVTSKTDDPSTNNNSSAHSLSVAALDLSVTKTGAATATAGDQVTYTITVTNNGPDTAVPAQLVDTLPPNTTFVSLTQNNGPAATCGTPPPGGIGSVQCNATLANGQSFELSLVLEVGNTPSVTNTAVASASQYDTNSANNSASATTTITPSSDLSIVKSGPVGVGAGTDATYTVTVTNAGISDASTVAVNDTLPAGTTFVSATQNSGPTFLCSTPSVGGTGTITCSIATFAAGASATFTFVLHVAPSAVVGSSIANTATVTSTADDPNSGNNSSTSTGTVSTDSDVSITKTGPAGAVPGGEIEYTLSVTNNGPADASTVELDDTLPANTTFVSLEQTAGPTFTCVTPAVGATGLVTCSAATLPAFGTATFTLTVLVAPDASGIVTNTATVSAANADPTPANNSGSAAVTIAAANVPTLSMWGLMLLAAALGMIVVLKK